MPRKPGRARARARAGARQRIDLLARRIGRPPARRSMSRAFAQNASRSTHAKGASSAAVARFETGEIVGGQQTSADHYRARQHGARRTDASDSPRRSTFLREVASLPRLRLYPAESPAPQSRGAGEPKGPTQGPRGESSQMRRSAALSARARQLTPQAPEREGVCTLPSSLCAPIRRRLALVIAAVACSPRPARAVRRARRRQHLGDRTLSAATSGHDVRVLQDYLTRAGYRTPIAGVFGPRRCTTSSASSSAPPPDGRRLVGRRHGTRCARSPPARRSAKQRADSSGGGSLASTSATARCKKGMRGHDVRVLQDYLTRARLRDADRRRASAPDARTTSSASSTPTGITADGVVGSGTVSALRGLGDTAGASGHCGSPRPVGHARLLLRRHRRRAGRRPAGDQGRDRRRQPHRDASRTSTAAATATWNDTGYDCSGSVSYALHGGGLLDAPARLGAASCPGARAGPAAGSRSTRTRPRLHGRRRPALRHERREPVALAVGHALRRRLRRAPPVGGIS